MGRNAVLDCSMFDPVTIGWIGRVNANGGTSNRATRKATDKLIQSARLNNWISKVDRLNLFAGDQLAAAMVPLLVGSGNAVETNNGSHFVSGDYTLTGGLVGNATNKYLQTGWVPSTALTTSLDAHYGAVVLAAPSNAANRALMGSNSSSFAQRFYIQWTTAGTLEDNWLGANTNSGAGYAEAGGPATGHLCRSNTDATHLGVYKDAVNKAGVSTMTNILASTEVYIFSINNGGSAATPAAYTLGGYHLGKGLTATDITNMYNAINTFCTAVGRTLP